MPLKRKPESSPDELSLGSTPNNLTISRPSASTPAVHTSSPPPLHNVSKAVSVVIPSPSRRLKHEIEKAGWTKSSLSRTTSPITGLSTKYYPTDDIERRAARAAHPRAKRVNRKDVPLSIGNPGAILTRNPPNGSWNFDLQLRSSLKRKLSLIKGPRVSLAAGDGKLLEGFASDVEFINQDKLHKNVHQVDESFNAGCACGDVCNPTRCGCLSQEVDSDDLIIPYQRAEDDPELWVLTPNFLKRTSMIFECTSRCGCDENCWNRVVQRGRTVRLEIFHTGNRGFGLRSPDRIRAGQFIDCYLGEVITEESADLREDLAISQNKHSYLFSLDFLVDDENTYVVDGQKFGSPTRFINHSCNPNCKMFPVSWNHGDSRLFDLAFFSLRDIPPMTEFTFDYNPTWEGSKKVDPSAVKCLCGEKNCRGQLWPTQRKGMK